MVKNIYYSRITFWSLTLVLLSVCVHPGAWAAATGEELFQQALLKESGERNLDAAVDLYKQVLAQPKVEKLLVFEARIRMGSCYERLGKIRDAEDVYEQIVKEASAPQSEFAQEAQANLRRLQAQERRVRVDTSTLKPETMVVATREFHATRASLSIGPAVLWSKGDSLEKLSLALRYRLSPLQRPSAIYVELGAVAPVGNSHIQNETKPGDAQTSDTGSLELHDQISVAIIGELPHGQERTVIPEAGAGLAVTDAKINVASSYSGTVYPPSNSASVSKRTVSPYLTADLHVWPDRIVSLLVQGSYTANPFPESVQVQTPPHRQTFDVPSSLWTISARLQVKIGWPNVVIKRKREPVK